MSRENSYLLVEMSKLRNSSCVTILTSLSTTFMLIVTLDFIIFLVKIASELTLYMVLFTCTHPIGLFIMTNRWGVTERTNGGLQIALYS